MNIILVNRDDFTEPEHVTLADRRAGHIIHTIRAAEGDLLLCGLINGNCGSGVVKKISGKTVKIEVKLETPPPPPLPLTLVLALPRPKAVRRVAETCACLGIKQIYIINAWRVEKSFWQSPVLTGNALEKALKSGLEQAKDTMMPEIFQKRFFTPFVKEELPLLSRGTLGITAHPPASTRCPAKVDQPVTLVMGPEGGFIDIEIKTLEAAGFRPVSLGRRILRTETAVPFIVSRLFSHLF